MFVWVPFTGNLSLCRPDVSVGESHSSSPCLLDVTGSNHIGGTPISWPLEIGQLCVNFANISLLYTEHLQLYTYWWPTIKLSSRIVCYLLLKTHLPDYLEVISYGTLLYTSKYLHIGGTPISWPLLFVTLCMASVSFLFLVLHQK